jgi:hypothetical protein
MMTRSYQVVAVSFRVSHPPFLTGSVDVVSPTEDFQFSQSEVHQLAMNEVTPLFPLFQFRGLNAHLFHFLMYACVNLT